MLRFDIRRPWCLLAWSSLVLLDPALAQPSGGVAGQAGPGEFIVVAPGDPVRVRPPQPSLRVEAAIDGGPLRPVSDSVSAPATPGSHWLTIASRNEGGALSPLRWTRLVVDDQGPEVSLEITPVPVADGLGNDWIPPGARARAHAKDRPAGVAWLSVAIDGTSTRHSGAEVDVTLPADGTVAVGAVASDTVGNQTSETARGFRIDARPPTGMIEIEGPRVETDSGWVLGPASRLTATIDDVESGLEGMSHRADGEAVEESRWSGAWPAGRQQASIHARDRVGNESVIGPLAFEVDDTPPAITWVVADGVTNDAGERYHRSPVTVTVTAVDRVAGVATLEHLAADAWRGISGPVVVEGRTLELRARDHVGNETTKQATWRVDDRAPTIELRRAGSVVTQDDAVLAARIGDALSVVVSDDESGIETATYRLNHQAVPGRRAKRLVDGTPVIFEVSGTHTLRVEARDRLGHEVSAQWRIEVAGRH